MAVTVHKGGTDKAHLELFVRIRCRRHVDKSHQNQYSHFFQRLSSDQRSPDHEALTPLIVAEEVIVHWHTAHVYRYNIHVVLGFGSSGRFLCLQEIAVHR